MTQYFSTKNAATTKTQQQHTHSTQHNNTTMLVVHYLPFCGSFSVQLMQQSTGNEIARTSHQNRNQVWRAITLTLTHLTERVRALNCYDYNFGNCSGQKNYHGGNSNFWGAMTPPPCKNHMIILVIFGSITKNKITFFTTGIF